MTVVVAVAAQEAAVAAAAVAVGVGGAGKIISSMGIRISSIGYNYSKQNLIRW